MTVRPHRARTRLALMAALLLFGSPSTAADSAVSGRHHEGVGDDCGGSGCHTRVGSHELAGPSGSDGLGEWGTTTRCLDCHDLASGAAPARLRGDGEAVCLECHAKALEPPRPRRMPAREQAQPDAPAEPRAHGPVAQGRCSACHRMHGRRRPGLLRGAFPPGDYARFSAGTYAGCFGACHDASLVALPKTKSATAFRNGEDNLHFRHVARLERGRSCRLCHAPHRSLARGLVREGMPYGGQKLTLRFSPGEQGGRCETSCHMPLEYARDKAIESPLLSR